MDRWTHVHTHQHVHTPPPAGPAPPCPPLQGGAIAPPGQQELTHDRDGGGFDGEGGLRLVGLSQGGDGQAAHQQGQQQLARHWGGTCTTVPGGGFPGGLGLLEGRRGSGCRRAGAAGGGRGRLCTNLKDQLDQGENERERRHPGLFKCTGVHTTGHVLSSPARGLTFQVRYWGDGTGQARPQAAAGLRQGCQAGKQRQETWGGWGLEMWGEATQGRVAPGWEEEWTEPSKVQADRHTDPPAGNMAVTTISFPRRAHGRAWARQGRRRRCPRAGQARAAPPSHSLPLPTAAAASGAQLELGLARIPCP